jgi:hypothetical protein
VPSPGGARYGARGLPLGPTDRLNVKMERKLGNMLEKA